MRENRPAPRNTSIFPDRTGKWFGRANDLSNLLARAGETGLTAVVGRPKMGKTWLLNETARQLSEDRGCIVGYHEALRQGSDPLLRAVANAYESWMADASLVEQAQLRLARGRGTVVGAAGKAVGILLDSVGKAVGGPLRGVGSLARTTFEHLALEQSQLLSGGIALPRLGHDDARDLVALLGQLSGQNVILILDAWEQSPSIESDYSTLARFLDRHGEWHRCHVFLGLRPDTPALDYANDLDLASPRAMVFALGRMVLDGDEALPLLGYLRTAVPAARHVDTGDLLHLLDGFPGVLSRWVDDSQRLRLSSLEDLAREAGEAQLYRYREFQTLFPGLEGDELRLAIRIALLPPVD